MLEQTLGFFNPWWFEEYIPPGRTRSEYLQKIERALEVQKSVIVSGLRRVGKTTILRQFIASRIPLIGGKRIFYASMDHPNVKNTSIIDLLAMFRRINKVKRQEKQLLVLDEVHYRPGFEKEIKALIDIEDGLKIVASGSSSLVVKHKSSAMTGRYMKIHVRPLSFKEYLEFNDESLDPSQPQMMEALLEDYLICGGMPQYVIHRDPQLLLDIIDDIIYKDIALEYEVRDPALLKELFFLLMDRVGKPLGYGKIGRLVNIGNDAAKKYIGYFQETYLLGLVEKHGTPNERKYSPKKCYCADNGFRVVMTGTRGIGSLAENLVFNILQREGDVRYYSKDNTEIDFIANNMAIEVKYKGKVSKNEVDKLRTVKARGVKDHLLISLDGSEVKGVRAIPLWKFVSEEA